MGSSSTTACTRVTPPTPLLVPAIDRVHALLGRVVRAVTADRGYGEAKIDQELHERGVTTVVIPRKGKPSQARTMTPLDASDRPGAGVVVEGL